MKLTRRQLRRLIREAINETKRYISSPDGNRLTPADRAFRSAEEKDMHAARVHPKIAKLVQGLDIESRVQGRELAHTIADEDSPLAQFGELTPEEETAIDYMGHARSIEQDPLGKGLDYPIDKEALYGAMKSRSKGVLKRLGFKYVEDLDISPKDYDDYFDDQFRFQAQALCCDVDDLAFVETNLGDQPDKTYEAVLDINKSRFKLPESMRTIPGDTGEFGSNSLHDLDGLLVLFTDHMSGYYTATICGK